MLVCCCVVIWYFSVDIAALATVVWCFDVVPHIKYTLRNTVFNVETAPSVPVTVTNNIIFYSEWGFDLFVDREIAMVDFHVFFELNFRRRRGWYLLISCLNPLWRHPQTLNSYSIHIWLGMVAMKRSDVLFDCWNRVQMPYREARSGRKWILIMCFQSSFELPQPQHTPPNITNSCYLGVSVVMVVRRKYLRE